MKIRAGATNVDITHPDKQLFGDSKIDKNDLAEYYQTVASIMLPHLRGRPLAVERFPDGITGNGFMQKQLPAHAPPFVHHTTVDKIGGQTTMIMCDNVATLLYLANQAALTLHPWLSHGNDPHRPDRLIFDLDPADNDFDTVLITARALHEILDGIGLASYPMTTGSRGIHVTVPISARDDFNDVRGFAMEVASLLVARHPEMLTTQVRKADRKGRLFVDTLRNAYAQHAVAPYSVRPLPGAPVATPLAWAELDEPGLTAQRYTIRDFEDRLASADPWRGMGRRAPSLGRARAKLAKLAAAEGS